MRVERPHHEFVEHVARNLRDGDVREFLPLSFANDKDELASVVTAAYADHPAGFAFLEGDEPIGIGAMVEARPNVCTLMFFATDSFPRIAIPLAKFTRNRLFPRYRENGVHRIECVSIDGYDEAHRWIEMVGLSREAVLPGYGRGGETYHQFAWASHAHPSGPH